MARPTKIPDGLRSLARLARARGWRIEHARSGHLHWTSPGGRRITTANTPSDHRTTRNDAAKLRRAGLNDRTT
jgi:hypothetical protein